MKYQKALARAEAKKESQETQEVVEVNEEKAGWRTEGVTQVEEEGGDLDPKQVRQGVEEMTYMIKTLGMFGFVGRSDDESKQGSDHDETD